MRALLSVELSFSWGFWARPYFLSGRQPSMNVPPPTTIVGALSRGIAAVLRAKGVSVPEYMREGGRYVVPIARDLGKCVDAVYFRLTKGVIYVNIDKTRLFQAPYIREENVKRDPAQWFAVRDVGKAYAPGAEAEAAFLIDLNCASRLCNALEAAAHAITRLGPAEGVVAVKRVSLLPIDKCVEVELGTINQPCPYFPARGEPRDPWVRAEFLDWRDERTWSDERPSAGVVEYAVPGGVWVYAQAEFPSCLTLRGYKGLKCGEWVYPV